MIDVFCVRGTSEPAGPSPVGMCRQVTEQLPDDRFTSHNIDYPASIGPVNEHGEWLGPSLESSRTAGVAELVARIRATPNMAGVIGYSLGALVVTEVLEGIADGTYPDLQLSWAALIANPARNEGDSIIRFHRGSGIAGGHKPFPESFPIWEVANPMDPITSADINSPLRTIADQITYASVADLWSWGNDLMGRAIRGEWQPIDIDVLSIGEQYAHAANDLGAYLFGGQHTNAYTQPAPGEVGSYVDLVAEHILAAA